MYLIVKIHNFWGDLTDVSAKTKALVGKGQGMHIEQMQTDVT